MSRRENAFAHAMTQTPLAAWARWWIAFSGR